MSDPAAEVAALTRDLVQMDSRTRLSNIAIADRIEAALAGFEIERLDFADAAGTPKRVLVAHRGGTGGDRVFRPHGHGAGHRLAGRPVVRAGSTPTACCTAWAAPT